jgi:diguanylate cyclase (GGDEF)-like protein/PAS domain S-box-containing protein
VVPPGSQNNVAIMYKSPSAKKTCIDTVETRTDGILPEVQLTHQIAILEATPDFVGYADAKTQHILYINQAGRKMIGLTKDEDVTKLKISDVHPEWTNQLFDKEILPAAIREGVWNGECAFRNRDGREIPVMMVLISHKALNGEMERFSTISRDITDRKQTEAMKESEQNYRSLFQNASIGIFHSLPEGQFLRVNHALAQMLGYVSPEEMISAITNISTQIYVDSKKHSNLLAATSEKTDWVYAENRYRRKNGTILTANLSVRRVLNSDGKLVYLEGFVEDITERKQMEEALKDSERRYRELSIVDDLTQLYNSRHFYFQLKIELDRSNRYEQPFTLLLLDLDNFKAFNDAYGHVEGDHVLRRLGHVVKRCLRETDLAYRYGGEEFTIVLPMTTSADGTATAERIRTEFKKETFSPVPGQEVHVTVSIGLAQYKPHEEMKAFVHRVDQLMYQGKKNGKDRVCSESSSQEQFKW